MQPREQFIEELLPVRPLCVRVTTWTGECPRCGPVESRHPLQTTTATGAAGTHLGPRAQTLAVLLSHRCGLTMGRTCQTLRELCGLSLSRGGLAQLLQRAASRLEPDRADLGERFRASAAVFADETRWYVGRSRGCGASRPRRRRSIGSNRVVVRRSCARRCGTTSAACW